MKKKIIFIINPISGHHNKSNFPHLVEKYIDKNQYEYNIVFTELMQRKLYIKQVKSNTY